MLTKNLVYIISFVPSDIKLPDPSYVFVKDTKNLKQAIEWIHEITQLDMDICEAMISLTVSKMVPELPVFSRRILSLVVLTVVLT